MCLYFKPGRSQGTARYVPVAFPVLGSDFKSLPFAGALMF